jgi:hypothetical protein
MVKRHFGVSIPIHREARMLRTSFSATPRRRSIGACVEKVDGRRMFLIISKLQRDGCPWPAQPLAWPGEIG